MLREWWLKAVAWFKAHDEKERIQICGIALFVAWMSFGMILFVLFLWWDKRHETGERRFEPRGLFLTEVIGLSEPQREERQLRDKLKDIQTILGSPDGQSAQPTGAIRVFQAMQAGGTLHDHFPSFQIDHLNHEQSMGTLSVQDIRDVCVAQMKEDQKKIDKLDESAVPVVAGKNPFGPILGTFAVVSLLVVIFMTLSAQQDSEKPTENPRPEEIATAKHTKTLAEIQADIEEEKARKRKAAQEHQPPPPPRKEKHKDPVAKRNEIRHKYEKLRQRVRQNSMTEGQKRWEFEWIDNREQEELNNEFL